MKPLVIYHGNCPDGFTAAWVAARALGDVELFAGKYQEDPPYELAAGRDVYVVDFSYPRAKLELLWEATKTSPSMRAMPLLVLDHHRTAEADLRGLKFCTFDMDRSGAGMAWDYFHPGEPRPWIVDYVEDRDLWRFKLPHSEAVSLYIRCAGYTLEAWDEMASLTVDQVLEQAQGCARYLKHYVDDALRNAYPVEFGWSDPTDPDDFYALRESKGIAVNCTYTGVSDVLQEALVRNPDAQVSIGWRVEPSGKLNLSFRSRPGFDCSLIAKAWGGGGHAQASGCIIDPAEHSIAPKLLSGGLGGLSIARTLAW